MVVVSRMQRSSKYSFNSSVVLAFALRILSVVSFSHKKEEG